MATSVSWLYTAPIALVVALVVLLVAGALELGHRMSKLAPIAADQVSSVSTPILSVVALLLAFSFSWAEDRYSLRRAAIVEEANAIGTFWLRASLMPDPVGSEMRTRVRRYVDVHLEHYQAGLDQPRLEELEAEAARLQDELWTLLEQEARQDPDSGRLRLVVPALNAMIDDGATVIAAKDNRLPDALVYHLFALVTVAGVIVGYRPRAEKRNLFLWGLLLVVLGGVMMVLLDIDRPRRGLIETDIRPFLRLRDSIAR